MPVPCQWGDQPGRRLKFCRHSMGAWAQFWQSKMIWCIYGLEVWTLKAAEELLYDRLMAKCGGPTASVILFIHCSIRTFEGNRGKCFDDNPWGCLGVVDLTSCRVGRVGIMSGPSEGNVPGIGERRTRRPRLRLQICVDALEHNWWVPTVAILNTTIRSWTMQCGTSK